MNLSQFSQILLTKEIPSKIPIPYQSRYERDLASEKTNITHQTSVEAGRIDSFDCYSPPTATQNIESTSASNGCAGTSKSAADPQSKTRGLTRLYSGCLNTTSGGDK